ncbi:toxin-antitoxin system HicB family antitoxin [Amycolatopsis magusensis]|uniref:toxin-antitoxin system HicB family antitoxin n=1 Tax=Amycolatopsis magusensis TaxID=882444 RepID=UPI0037ABB223
MDLTPYVDSLRTELALAAEAGGEEARALAERLTAPLESAVRLTLLEALTAAAEEITRDLAPGSVDLRLRGRNTPNFVVTQPAAPPAEAPAPEPVTDDEGPSARINLRLPENLKLRIEEAAGAEGLSINAWLVRAAGAALTPSGRRGSGQRDSWTGQHLTGWVR